MGADNRFYTRVNDSQSPALIILMCLPSPRSRSPFPRKAFFYFSRIGPDRPKITMNRVIILDATRAGPPSMPVFSAIGATREIRAAFLGTIEDYTCTHRRRIIRFLNLIRGVLKRVIKRILKYNLK